MVTGNVIGCLEFPGWHMTRASAVVPTRKADPKKIKEVDPEDFVRRICRHGKRNPRLSLAKEISRGLVGTGFTLTPRVVGLVSLLDRVTLSFPLAFSSGMMCFPVSFRSLTYRIR